MTCWQPDRQNAGKRDFNRIRVRQRQSLDLSGARKAAGVFAKFGYTLDSVGNRTSKVVTGAGIPSRTETYGYDAIDQITQAVYGAARTVNYAYDAAGNRTVVAENGFTSSYSANSLNQYTVVGSSSALAYDAKGNLTPSMVRVIRTTRRTG